ncbi:MAG: hypothetical protein H0W50_06745 [Parachlamydiaceae bacterium]|nr:hypothetical protein [Parachlamydiaceae bacterium]
MGKASRAIKLFKEYTFVSKELFTLNRNFFTCEELKGRGKEVNSIPALKHKYLSMTASGFFNVSMPSSIAMPKGVF